MIRVLQIAAALGALFFPVFAKADEEFVPVDPSTLDTVNGELMMIIAYGVIGMLVALYSLRLYLGQKKIQKRTSALLGSLNRVEE